MKFSELYPLLEVECEVFDISDNYKYYSDSEHMIPYHLRKKDIVKVYARNNIVIIQVK